MSIDHSRYAGERVRVYLADLLCRFLRFYEVRSRVWREMEGLAEQFRATIRHSDLILRVKRSHHTLPPSSLRWMVLARPPAGSGGVPPGPPRRRWYHPLRGSLTNGVIYTIAHQIRNAPVFYAFDRRATLLNQAARKLTEVSRSLNLPLKRLSRPLPNETPPPPLPSDLLPPSLPPKAHPLVGNAWRVLYRIAFLEAELVAIVHRWHRDDLHRGCEPVFERNASFPWGRVRWYDGLHGRYLGSLTYRMMSRLEVPVSRRKLVYTHERHRREITHLHRRFTAPLGDLKQRLEAGVGFAWRRLEESQGISIPVPTYAEVVRFTIYCHPRTGKP